MKITQESSFKPITITLETQREAEILLAIVGASVGSGISDKLQLFSKLPLTSKESLFVLEQYSLLKTMIIGG